VLDFPAVMDYKSFEKAIDRAGKALFLDDDTERCMKIMQSVISKFGSVRYASTHFWDPLSA
jgi:hypothetical protein